MQLTIKQKNLLDSIREYTNQRHENPTGYGLQKYLETEGVRDSLKSVMQVIEALERKKLIKRDSDKKIYLVENRNYTNLKNIFSIPLYGLASCGDALAYADNLADGYLQVSKKLFTRARPKNLFAVNALGDSMNQTGIRDGDYVIFEKYQGESDFVLEGRIVVAIVNGMATIKIFRKVEKDIIGLFPCSKNKIHQPIFIHKSDSFLIAGIFQKVLPVKYVSL